MAEESPLIKALPPATDYWTYLTIIEYNLTSENLSTLHKVLQDETLTANIGWDLVHLLVPHLPDSEQCLQDIARLGNPREVILKVTESLRLIACDQNDEDGEAYSPKTAPPEDGSAPKQGVEGPEPLPLPVQQFVALLSMLEILHTRIKTRFPSRFLSTTLQAILASFSNSYVYREEMVQAIVKTVKAVSHIARPALPSRNSSGMLGSGAMAKAQSAADPEGPEVVESEAEETALQTKLLQAFLTHIIEEYMLNFQSYDDVPGIAWCSRIMEQLHPDRIVPKTKTFAGRFASEKKLHRRIDAIGQLVTLAQDLKLSNQDLQAAAMTAEKVSSQGQSEDEPPNSVEDIPLSRLGSLLLYTARRVSSVLYHRPLAAVPSFQLFPDHQELMKHCMAAHEMGNGQLGTEPEALIDAVLALGLLSLEKDKIGNPATEQQFTEYLHVVALLSSNCPNANLRGHAHYLTSAVLRSQPDEEVRLSFIRDTLEHCPFENLKVSAVGWIKHETIEANPRTPVSGRDHEHEQNRHGNSIFANPFVLGSLAPYLFPDLHTDLVGAPIQDAWMVLQTNVSFYLASLNLLYLLLCARHLHQRLEIPKLWKNRDLADKFLRPLRDATTRFSKALDDGGGLASEKSDTVIAELTLLGETVERVTKAVPQLNEGQCLIDWLK